MLQLAVTTLLALQAASASPNVAPAAAPPGQGAPAAQQSSPAAVEARTTPTPRPPPTPTPPPRFVGDVVAVVNKSDDSVSLLDGRTGRLQTSVPVEAGSHEIELLADKKTAAVASYGRAGQPGRSVTLLDLPSGKVVSKIDIGEGSRPHGLKALPDGRLLVTAEGARELVIVDPRSGTITQRIPVGREVSHMVAASPDGKVAYVTSLSAGSVIVVDLPSRKVVREIPTGKGAEGVDVTPDGREIWVANRAANTISVIDAKTLAVAFTIQASEFPIRVRITPEGRRAVVTFTGSGDVGIFDVANRAETKRIAIGREAVEGTETRVFRKRFGASPAPVGLLISPDGKRVFVSASHADVVSVIDLDTLRVEDAWMTGREPDGLAERFVPKPPDTPTPRPERPLPMRPARPTPPASRLTPRAPILTPRL